MLQIEKKLNSLWIRGIFHQVIIALAMSGVSSSNKDLVANIVPRISEGLTPVIERVTDKIAIRNDANTAEILLKLGEIISRLEALEAGMTKTAKKPAAAKAAAQPAGEGADAAEPAAPPAKKIPATLVAYFKARFVSEEEYRQKYSDAAFLEGKDWSTMQATAANGLANQAFNALKKNNKALFDEASAEHSAAKAAATGAK